MGKLSSFWTQCFRIPKPVIDEESLADQRGKVSFYNAFRATVGWMDGQGFFARLFF